MPSEPQTLKQAPDLRKALSKEEIRDLLAVSDLRGAFTIALDWGMIAAAFALVAWSANPFTIVFALVVIGTRQLGLAVVMHEGSHHTMFCNRKLNDWASNWLAAYPIWADIHAYRPYHLKHHAHTGGPGDPDLGLVRPFPITRQSFYRKVWRDLSGQTGWKQFVAVAKRDLGLRTQGTMLEAREDDGVAGMSRGETNRTGWHRVMPVVLTNAVLLGVLALFGRPELYLLWVVAWFTTYRLVTRIRSIAEHAMAPDPLDPMRNTRTTRARWWERLLLAPNRVNFHLEHHLLMTVPHYNLPRMHRLLEERGVLENGLVVTGYAGVLREASSRAA